MPHWPRLLALLAGLALHTLAAPVTLDFESLGDGESVGSHFPGLVFENAIAVTAGITLNEFEFPPASGIRVISDSGGPILISFAAPVLSLAGSVTYLAPLTFTAFDSGGGQVAQALSLFSNNLALSGDPGSSPNEVILVDFPAGISSVRIAGDPLGGSFTLDDFQFEAAAAEVPEPSSAAMLTIGCVVFAAFRSSLARGKPRLRHRRRAGGILRLAVLPWLALPLIGAPDIGPAVATPSTVIAGVATPVTVVIEIRDPTVIPGSVNLLRLSSGGAVLATLGVMVDDGTKGDALAGDRRFSLNIQVDEPAPTQVRLQVSAAFRGMLARVRVDVSPLVVRLDEPPVAVIAWTPTRLELNHMIGTAQNQELRLVFPAAVKDASVSLAGAAAAFLRVTASTFDGLPTVNEEHSLAIRVVANAAASPGRYEGTIVVRSGAQPLPAALPVVLNLVAPSASVVPMKPSEPSPDRVVTERSQRLIGDELLVVLRPETADPVPRIRQIAQATGAVILGGNSVLKMYQLRYAGRDVPMLSALKQQLKALPDVHSASLSVLFETESQPRFPLSDSYYDSWNPGFPDGNNWHHEFIGSPLAWELHTGSSAVNVAVIDRHFDAGHGDLKNNVVLQPIFSGRDNRHGTHVAGLACAEGDNGRGVAGVAWQCGLQLHPVGSGDIPAIIIADAMLSAAVNGARVVNVSMAGVRPNQCGPIQDEERLLELVDDVNAPLAFAMSAVERQGYDILWVFSAGNECRDVKYQSPASLAAVFPDNVITVTAVTRSGDLNPRANFGDAVTVAAPGGDGSNRTSFNITSTLPRSPCILGLCDNYGELFGTSMAAPQVAGLAALVFSAHPDFSASQVRRCIVDAARSSGASVPGHNFHVIDAPEAVRCARKLECGDVFSGSIATPGEVHAASVDLKTGELASFMFRQWNNSEPGSINARFVRSAPGGSTSGNLEDFRQTFVPGQDGSLVRIEALGVGGGTGSYKIGFNCVVPPKPVAGVLAKDSIITGRITDPVTQHLYTFDGRANDIVTVTIRPGSPDPLSLEMRVHAPTQNHLQVIQFGGTRTIRLPATGRYVLQISVFAAASDPSYWSGGSYWFSLVEGTDPQTFVPARLMSPDLTCGSSRSGIVNTQGGAGFLRFAGDPKPVQLTLSGSGSYFAVMHIPNFTSGSGRVFYSSPLVSGSQRLLLPPANGPYYIQVGTGTATGAGSYSVRIDCED